MWIVPKLISGVKASLLGLLEDAGPKVNRVLTKNGNLQLAKLSVLWAMMALLKGMWE